jgi:hypothetical protein
VALIKKQNKLRLKKKKKKITLKKKHNSKNILLNMKQKLRNAVGVIFYAEFIEYRIQLKTL